jgi:hypothetical protein
MGKKPKAGRALREDSSESAKKTQAERFIEAARQLGVDESGDEFEGALNKITKRNAKK